MEAAVVVVVATTVGDACTAALSIAETGAVAMVVSTFKLPVDGTCACAELGREGLAAAVGASVWAPGVVLLVLAVAGTGAGAGAAVLTVVAVVVVVAVDTMAAIGEE